MNQEIGPQYDEDKRTDPSGFLQKTRLHQSKFRAFILKVQYDKLGNYLTQTDAQNGLNFYDDFEIFREVKKRYSNYNRQLQANMLRSEHIGFNLFVPFKKNHGFAKEVLNRLLSGQILSIDEIKFEYAPRPARNYLNDRTAFDVYIEYTNTDYQKGIIGVEVKYTEGAYRLKPKSKEATVIDDPVSKYHTISKACGLYKPESIALLKTDNFRQVWRNQLLGESILIEDKDDFKHFTSLIIFPEGNIHFVETSKEYCKMLNSNNDRFVPVTFEEFIATCGNCQPDNRLNKWLLYLKERYIIN